MFNFLKTHNEIFIALFGFVIFISIAAGNTAMALAIVTFLYCCYSRKDSLKADVYELLANSNFKYYMLGVGLFFASTLLSVLFSEDVITGIKLWAERWPWRFMFFLMPVITIKKDVQARNILLAILTGLAITCCYMIFQGFVAGENRANGFYGHPMMLAGILCEILPVLLVMLLNRDMFKLPKYSLEALFAVGLLALLANGTRGAWLACVITFVIILLFYIKKYPKQVMAILLCFAIAGGCIATSDRFVKRIDSMDNVTTDTSNTARLYMWRSAVAMYNDHPVLGVGEGQYRPAMEKYYVNSRLGRVYDHSHSIIFHVLCVDGLLGLTSMLLMFGMIICTNIKCFFKYANPWCLAMATSAIALFLQGLTEYNIGQSSIMKMFWLFQGCLFVLAYFYGKAKKESDQDE